VRSGAHATTSGPIEVEVLGADGAGKTYWLEHFHDESGRVPNLWYVTSGEPVRVASLDRMPEDDARARIDRLRGRLRRLPRAQAQLQSQSGSHRWRRFVRDLPAIRETDVAVHLSSDRGSRDVEVQTYRSPRVRIRSAFALPDGRTLVVLRFVGVPYESAYERQIAVPIP
jgi:hypothetical protein